MEDTLAVVGVGFAVFLAEVFAQGRLDGGGVDELHQAATSGLLAVGDDPYEGTDTGVIEVLFGHGNDGFQEVVLDDVSAQVTLSAASVSGAEARAVVPLHAARAQLAVLHAGEVVGQEEHLGVAHVGDEVAGTLLVISSVADKAGVGDAVLLLFAESPGAEILFPRCAEGGIGEAEVEGHAWVSIVADGGSAEESFANDAARSDVGEGGKVALLPFFPSVSSSPVPGVESSRSALQVA